MHDSSEHRTPRGERHQTTVPLTGTFGSFYSVQSGATLEAQHQDQEADTLLLGSAE